MSTVIGLRFIWLIVMACWTVALPLSAWIMVPILIRSFRKTVDLIHAERARQAEAARRADFDRIAKIGRAMS